MFKKTLLSIALVLTGATVALAQTDTTTTKTTTTKTTTTKAPATQTVTTANTAQTPEQKLVRAAFDRLVKGIEESDVETVMSVYQNSPNTLYFNHNGTVTRGYEQDRINREAQYPKVTNAKLNPTNVRVEILGATGALLTCQWTQTREFDGKPETASGRMTLVFKKIGKDWKIIHLHTSPDNVPAARPVFPSERTTNQ